MGYYSKRKDDLEKRKSEVISRIYVDKLSLKSINAEITKCDDAIQKLGEPGKKEFTIMQKEINDLKVSLSEKDKEIESLKKNINKNDVNIVQLNKTLDKVKKRRKNLTEENTKLKRELEHSKKIINNLELKLLANNAHNDDVILADNFGKENIFNEIIKSDKK